MLLARRAAPAARLLDDRRPITELRVMVPNSPGGGYDVTGRTAVKITETTGITDPVEVFNLSGAGGALALTRLMHETGNADLLMMMGLGVIGATVTDKSTATGDRCDADRSAHRGAGSGHGAGGLPVRHHRGADRRVARASGSVDRRRRIADRWARPSDVDAVGRGRRDRSAPRSATSRTTVAASCCRPWWATRWTSPPRGSGNTPSRSVRTTAGTRGLRGCAGRRTSTRRRSPNPASPWCSPTGAE